MKKPEYWVASSVVVGALLVLLAFTVALGKTSLWRGQRKLKMEFESVNGLTTNSTIRFAGATVGRVTSIHVLPREKQLSGPDGLYCVEVVGKIDPALQLGDDIGVEIRQDGLLGSRYISIVPGSPVAPPLAADRTLMGTSQMELTDLAAPGRDLIAQLRPVVANLQPTTAHLATITAKLDESLPDLINSLDSVLSNSDELLGTVNSPENRERLTRLLANLRVISDNLKVVSTNAKALTATLADKPWRLLWGGKTVHPPSESEIMKSDKALPVGNGNAIEVEPANPPAKIDLPPKNLP